MSSAACRLRKYRRRVERAMRTGRGLDRLLTLKWRYWHQVFGRHQTLWGEP